MRVWAGICMTRIGRHPVRISSLRTRTGMVLKTLVLLPFNHITKLVARESFTALSSCESFKSYTKYYFAVI
jgi:hypothetical protein